MEKILNIIDRMPRWFWHVLFWISFLLYNTVQNGYWRRDYESSFYQYLLYLPAIILATYLVIYWLIPKYLERNRLLLFFIFLLISVFAVTILQRSVTQFIISPLLLPEYVQKQYLTLSLFQPFYFVSHMMSIYSIVTIVVMLKLFKKWSVQKQNTAQILTERYNAEIQFLKSQIQPHFLFNVMNSIYGLALKNSPRTPEIILKFSDLLSYMLYECNEEKVTLAKELEMLQNYLALEKIRFGDRISVQFENNLPDKSISIAPLLLFPFVENAVKHGASADDQEIPLHIQIYYISNELIFSVKNRKSKYLAPQVGNKNNNSGIGIKNVKRRLELIYPDRHDLKCSDNEKEYCIELKIKFDETR